MTPDSKELQPCPCCNFPAPVFEFDEACFVGQTYPNETGNTGYKFRCDRCGLQTCWWHSEQQARDAWNTRPAPQPGMRAEGEARPTVTDTQQSLTPEMVRLVLAARHVAFVDHDFESLCKLDEASEAFANVVPWDDDPNNEIDEVAAVPPPDGAAITTEQLDQLQFGRALHDRPPPPSDDVRSALADEIEQSDGLIKILLDGRTSQLGIKKTAIIIAALRSAPVSAPVERNKQAARIQEIFVDTLRIEDGEIVGTGPASYKIADAFSAPVVGVTREAIELILEKTAREKSGLYLSPVCKSAMADAILALRSPAPDATVSELPDESRYIKDVIENAMLTMWNEICSDTGCHPLDIDRLGGRKLGFHRDHWARMTAEMASSQILKLNLPSAPVSARDAVIEEIAQYDFPYQRTFDALAAATDVLSGPPNQKQLSISVRKFQEAFNSHRDKRAIRSLTGAKP